MTLKTLKDLFHFNIETYNKADLLIYRGHDGGIYKISSNEFRERVVDCALGLKELGVKPETKVIFLSENRPEWHIADFACHLLGAVVVPVFPTLVAEQVGYIVNDSDSEIVIVSDQTQAKKISEIRDKIKKVRYVIAMDPTEAKNEMMPFGDVLRSGADSDEEDFLSRIREELKPESLATIIYTSGTTGPPKGVMLSHRNIVTNAVACADVLDLSPSDRAVSFLPLSHSFERTVDYLYFYRGLSIMYSPKIESVVDDLAEVQPTIMAAVPRFYEKVRNAVEQKANESGGLKKAIFEWSAKVAERKTESDLNSGPYGFFDRLKYALADKLVFAKIRARTGGRIRYFISGGAPLSAEVGRFFYGAGLKILEGYGLSETAPVISVNPPARPKFGTVGKPLRDVEVREAKDGEILAKGPNIMMGYYKMPKETEEVFSDGWFRTGDVGKMDAEGYLVITDRKKQLIVTSVGKKVAPQIVEKQVESSRFIEQVMLIGEKRNFISALIVPNYEALRTFLNDSLPASTSNKELVENDDAIKLIEQELEELQKELSNYERIQKFKLLPEEFTVENGLLTPTMKVKRRVVEEKYRDAIESLYAN